MSLVAEILEYIKTSPGSSAADICDAFQYPRPAVQRAAYRLYDAGYTTRSGEKNKFLYTFNESRIESDVKPLQETRHAKALISRPGNWSKKGFTSVPQRYGQKLLMRHRASPSGSSVYAVNGSA
jgi:DNA-binding transcriptional ArsR family regulator